MSQQNCEVTFKVKVITNLNQHVKIIGSIPELGLWDTGKAFPLSTNNEEYPYWTNYIPLILPKSKKKTLTILKTIETKFEFKIVVYEYGTIQRWEEVPNGLNRKYKVRYPKSHLHIAEGDLMVREIAIETFKDSFPSLDICKLVLIYKSLIVLLASFAVRKNLKKSFNLFKMAGSDDEVPLTLFSQVFLTR